MKVKNQNWYVSSFFVFLAYIFIFIQPLAAESYLDTARALSKAFENAASRITPSLVSISSMKQVRQARAELDPRLNPFREFFGDELFKRHFEPQFPGGFTHSGLGSGFIWDSKGHILTNNHVIEGADQIKVRLQDKREFSAILVGSDPQTDIAVLKIEADNLVPVRAGNSDDLVIGEWVVAAGNPFGLDHSITAGIVSAKGRAVSRSEQYEDFIQTDAAINVGNSGGPLLNLSGEVIGINTMILSKTGGNHGIGFAIPINLASSISNQLIDSGQVARGWLGVGIQDLNDDLRGSFNFQGQGVLVGDVTKDGPAFKAAIEPGDIITSFNGRNLSSANELRNQVANTKPDSQVEVNVVRQSRELKLKVNLARREQDTESKQPLHLQNLEKSKIEELGLELIDITSQLRTERGIDTQGSVMVTNVLRFSPADNVGLQPNDIILKVGNEEIQSVEQLKKILSKAELKQGVRLVVETAGMKRFVFIKS